MFDLIGTIKKKTGFAEMLGDGLTVPKSVQDVIRIDAVYSDGIFMTGKEQFSKTFKFTDINYAVSSKEDKETNFLRYSEILNSLENGVSSQITIVNRKLKKTELKEMALLERANDGKDKYRKEINDMLTMLANGANAIVQDKYITVTVQKKTIQEARTHFSRVGADLIAHFSRLGSKCTELNLTERLRIIHDFCRPNEAADYRFDLRDTMRKGQNFKDYIAPDGFEFKADYFKAGDKFARVLFIRDYPSYVKDSVVWELTDTNRNMIFNYDIIPVSTEEAQKFGEKQALGIETNIANYQRKQNANNNYTSVIPYDLEQQRKEIREFLDDLTTRDQKMFKVVLTVMHTADTLEELNNDTEAITAMGRKHRIKDIGVKTKEKVNENTSQPESVSPEQYATDKVTDGMRTGAETAATGTKKVVQKGVDKIKEKRADTKARKAFEEELKQVKAEDVSEPSPATDGENPNPKKPKEKSTSKKSPKQNTNKPIKEKSQSAPKSTEQETSPKVAKQKKGKAVKEKTTTLEIKEKVQSTPKVRQTEKAEVIDEVKKPRQRKQTPPKTKAPATVKKATAENKSIRTIGADAHKVKQSKRSIENSRKSIKTANNGVKTAKKTTKTAKTTAKQSAEIAQRTKQAAKVAVKTTVKTLKAAGKAIVAGTKALVASIKEIGAAIYAGGPVVLIIIIVVCLIAAIGGTCFGIFLSNDETTGTDKTMSQAIAELTSEHYANLTAMKASYSYDLFEVQGNSSINWKDVLAIYAVKTTTSTDKAMEVVTLDEKKLDLLREIVNDMNTMTGVVTPKLVAETTVTTDAEGNPVKTTTYVTKKVLTVVIAQLNANQTAELYKFNDEQKAQLSELMSEEYEPLWNELIGANGDIIIGEGSWQGTAMFTWPLAVDGTITSRFGTRTDPISGEIKTHGGTDIASATGTSILAATDGTVISATWHNSYGYYVKIKHNDTYSTLYAHCSALLVSAGQTVKQGQVIAQVGSTGYSTGPHLHFEVIQNGVRVDALRFYAQ